MGLHRRFADEECLTQLAVGHPLGEQAEQFGLTGGKRFLRALHLLDKTRGHSGRENAAPGYRAAHRAEDLVGR
ncbi:Uncharacterised protein [Mycobacteroides abscessus subsp. abscessus]|nr:Uncharacterised protein [Mycobacteroides abscessus subsp. abscessus]